MLYMLVHHIQELDGFHKVHVRNECLGTFSGCVSSSLLEMEHLHIRNPVLQNQTSIPQTQDEIHLLNTGLLGDDQYLKHMHHPSCIQ